MLHIAFGDSAGGTLKQMLRGRGLGDQVTSFADDLSWGPIAFGIQARTRFFDEQCPIPGTWAWLEDHHNGFQNSIRSSSEKLLIWLGSSCTREFAGYMAHLDLLLSRPSFVIRPGEFLAPHETYGRFASVGLLAPDQLASVFDDAERLPASRDEPLLEQWSTLVAENALLRIITDNALQSAPLEFFDHFILQVMAENWTSGRRIIANALAASFDAGASLTTEFLASRLKGLADAGEIEIKEATGDQADGRFFESQFRKPS